MLSMTSSELPTGIGVMARVERLVEHHDQTARPVRGRGSVTNRSGRFEANARILFDDGWTDGNRADDGSGQIRTSVTDEPARRIITRNESPDIGFDRSINPYRGCEHGCSYCFARPTHAYMGLSPGLDFETRLFAKPDAARLLERELAAPGYKVRSIAMGTNTDPYQPIERERRITRQILEVLARCNHPVGIVTKNALIVRDIDILAPMAAKGLARVALSVTTLDGKIARAIEPRASTPGKRLAAIKALSDAGIPTGVSVAPVIPGLTDNEMEAILEAASNAGAKSASYIALRLPLEVRDLFVESLLTHFPDRADRVMSLIAQMREGRHYQAEFGKRMRGTGPLADLIAKRFHLAIARLGLNRQRVAPRCDLFQPPRNSRQPDLFDGL
ncbi:MAG: PA0069 family radical SAM protein [Rhodobiaceae bacterium]|nr:PA0069 family radical SAM protein [Rhodobiaceae bacterium]MCC0054817.1 PA0069 family radical SAM protein [Rhodobiaceae bacterium]